MEKILNILVVDDEQIVLDSICKHLRNEKDYTVYTALSVEAAFKEMENVNFNIILTDLMMPEIDGLEFLKIMKERQPNVLVIMITGYATINTALQAMQLGAFDYLAKPFTKDELRNLIHRAADIAVAAENGNSSGYNNTKLTEVEKITSSIKGIGEHSWFMKEESGDVLIGVERTFLIGIGRIQSVYLPSLGDEVRQGGAYFQIFTTDLRSQSLLSPLSGIVIELNAKVLENPNNTLLDPYGQGWLMRIAPTKFDEEVGLMGL